MIQIPLGCQNGRWPSCLKSEDPQTILKPCKLAGLRPAWITGTLPSKPIRPTTLWCILSKVPKLPTQPCQPPPQQQPPPRQPQPPLQPPPPWPVWPKFLLGIPKLWRMTQQQIRSLHVIYEVDNFKCIEKILKGNSLIQLIQLRCNQDQWFPGVLLACCTSWKDKRFQGRWSTSMLGCQA